MFQEDDNYLIMYLLIVIIIFIFINYISNLSCNSVEGFFATTNKDETLKTNKDEMLKTNKDEMLKTKMVNLKTPLKITNTISDALENAKFKLRVELPDTPPYIKGSDFKNGEKDNWFYLCIEKMNPNCNVKSISGTCMNIYVDKKNCDSKLLSNYVQNNPYRLVLVTAKYVFDKDMTMGKNCTFTLNTINGKQYLKNVETGYILSLYENDITQSIYGEMIDDNKSNINTIVPYVNEKCSTKTKETNVKTTTDNKKQHINDKIHDLDNKSIENFATNPSNLKTKFVSCNINPDKNTYLITSKNFATSSPISIEINKDNTISLKIIQYDFYGTPNKNYYLSSCNFNVKTLNNIETITNKYEKFYINLVCINKNSDNKLKLSIELDEYSNSYLKDQYVHDV